MPNDPLGEFMRNIERYLDAQDPDYPTALINLIDIMRVFLRVDEELGRELLRDEAITPAQFYSGMAENEPLRKWLKKHEDHGIDPSLHGTIKREQR